MTDAAQRSNRIGATLSCASAAAMWGCWSLFLRPSGLSVWASAPMLFAVTAVVMLPATRLDPPAVWERSTLGLLLLAGLLDALNVATFFGAMDRTSVAIAVLTHYLAPLLVALLAPFVDRERLPGAPLAAAVGTIGLVLVLSPWSAPVRETGRFWGGLLGGASAFAYAGNVFVMRRLSKRIGAGRATSYHALVAFLLLLPLGDARALAAAQPRSLALVLAGALLPGSLAGWLFVRGLGRIGASRAAVIAFLEPLVAVVIGWIVFGEQLESWALAGGVLILGAGLWVTLAKDAGTPATVTPADRSS